jgi:hypothetical protein
MVEDEFHMMCFCDLRSKYNITNRHTTLEELCRHMSTQNETGIVNIADCVYNAYNMREKPLTHDNGNATEYILG